MKYQRLIFQKIIKNNTIKTLIVLYILFLILIINYVMIYPNEINYITYNIILGNINVCNYDFVCLLWVLFNSLLIIYIQFSFLIFEFDNSLEFVILRKPMYVNLFEKIVLLIIIDIIYKLIIIIIAYVFLANYCPFSYNIFISNLYYTLFLSIIALILFLCYYIYYNKKN